MRRLTPTTARRGRSSTRNSSSRYRLAKTIGVSETVISEIVKDKRGISAAMAWRLSRALGTTPDFWANLQTDCDLLAFDPNTLGDIQPPVTA